MDRNMLASECFFLPQVSSYTVSGQLHREGAVTQKAKAMAHKHLPLITLSNGLHFLPHLQCHLGEQTTDPLSVIPG